MTVQIPTNEPLELRVGDTWQWRREDLTDYPAPTWSLKYALKSATQHVEITASADGSQFAVTVARATTATYTAGTYTWVGYVESSTERFEIDRGSIVLLPSYSAASQAALDDRTHARKTLTLIEAAIEALNFGTKSYQIHNRAMTKRDLPELYEMRSRYKREVEAEDLNARLDSGQLGAPRLLARL